MPSELGCHTYFCHTAGLPDPGCWCVSTCWTTNSADPNRFGFFRGWLIWICTVRKGGIHPGSAGLGLIISKWLLTEVYSFKVAEQKDWKTVEINLCNPWHIQMFSTNTVEAWSEILVLARFLYTPDWLQLFMNELALLCTWYVLIDQVDLSL